MKFGCIPSSYDSRDYTLKTAVSDEELPKEFILDFNVPVKNQKNVSSCVAHATSSALEYYTSPYKELSTNFIYGIRKQLFNSDCEGMSLRDACKIAADYGDMLLEDCPGNTEAPDCFEIANEAFADKAKTDQAKNYRILKYFLCPSKEKIKYALYHYGPVLAAIKWYDTFKLDNDGVLTGAQKGSFGFHVIVIYGYTENGFLCQNSWGSRWGNQGRFILPYNIKPFEARGLIDWNGYDDLKEPMYGGIWNLLYKSLNAIVNFVRKILNI